MGVLTLCYGPAMRSRFAARTGLALLGLAEVAAASIALLALLMPASAQIDDRFPFLEDRRRRYRPTLLNGVPIEILTTIEIDFKLTQ